MPAVKINVSPEVDRNDARNPLPQLLHTPAGLAIIEIQGTIHAPFAKAAGADGVQVGKLEFPLYDGRDDKEGVWMKKVYMYIGQYQRLGGEVRKLSKPMAVLAKRGQASTESVDNGTAATVHQTEQLDILAIVKYKIIFSSRPEPVSHG